MEKLGVFDSGIGGFNVVSELRKNLDVDILFLADQENLPYGEKSESQLKEILKENMMWFKNKGVKRILLACNTASTFVDYLRSEFFDLQIDSIIEITSQQFDKVENLLIVGTKVTTQSKEYDKHLSFKSNYLALNQLASLVEQNNQEAIKNYLEDIFKDIDKSNNLLLACTHYSIVKKYFEEIFSANIYDSIIPVLKFYKNLKGNRKLDVYTSGNVKTLYDQLTSIFDYKINVNVKADNFEIVVVSDNHGQLEPIETILKRHSNAKVFIHCGDVELDKVFAKDYFTVAGNNDYYNEFADFINLKVNGLNLFIVHGHQFSSMNRLNEMYEKLHKLKIDIVFFGHEHIFQNVKINEMLIINPGSLFYNRDHSEPSYALLSVKDGNVSVKRMKY